VLRLNRDALETLARAEGLTHTALARRLGISRSYLFRLLNGQRRPGVKFIYGLRAAFPQYSPDFFVLPDEKGA